MIDASDLARAGLGLLLAPIAWGVAPRRWAPLCHRVASAWAHLREFQDPTRGAIVSRALGRRMIALPAESIFARTLAHNVEFMLQLLRSHRPGGWQPDARLEGQEQIDQALCLGRGVILWVHRFRPFVHFVALHKAGFRVCRPSGRYHGEFYRSRLGRRWLNPLQTAVEDRYCERIPVRERTLAHLRDLQQRLNQNGLVSMYADYLHGTRNIEVPFLEGWLSLSTQPVSLAIARGAPVLPIFPISDGAGSFRVIVEPPIELDPTDDHRVAVETAVTRHARRLEWYVLQYPDQWHSWWSVRR